jgi:hypothetical protein
MNDPDRRDALTAWALLGALLTLYLVFLFLYVPRLTNYVLSDREFTGWVGPIAERVLRGERPYVDFVLPIPPGSFALLAVIQRLAGGALLLQELWVAAIAHLVMGVLAYAIAACFSTRRVALLVSFTTLVLVTQTPKACVYDHTSLLVVWSSVLAGSLALTATEDNRRRRFWFVAGLLSTLSLGFKQSTAIGMTLGWALASAYLVGIETWQKRPREALGRARDAAACALGGVVGLLFVVLLLVALHASIPGFVQAVLRDGPALKGGPRALLRNLFTFTARNDAIRNAIVPTAIVITIGFGVARRQGNLHVGDDAELRRSVNPRFALFFGGAFVATYGVAIALLAADVHALHRVFVAAVDSCRNVPAFGFVFAAAFFAAHLVERYATTARRRDQGHALNAVFLAALACTMIYDTSFVQFYPFYYNEPSIPLALLCLYMATERSGLIWATPLTLAVSVLPTYGVEMNRALSADVPVVGGQWSGLRVNYRGAEVLKAATRARELAGPGGSVLVLPEDVELTGLIHRRRPPLMGAIVFVDQYPKRLLAQDLATLDRNLPEVIVIHPRRVRDWKSVFGTWSEDSAAARLIVHVLEEILPGHYVLDSSYPTIFFWDQGQIDVYVRKDASDS